MRNLQHLALVLAGLVALAPNPLTRAENLTLYMYPPALPTIQRKPLDAAPISKDESGSTYYVARYAAGETLGIGVESHSGTTQPYASGPTAVAYTFRADASGYYQSFTDRVLGTGRALDVTTDCHTDPNDSTILICEQVVAMQEEQAMSGSWDRVPAPASTYTTTLSGRKVPILTIANIELYEVSWPTATLARNDERPTFDESAAALKPREHLRAVAMMAATTTLVVAFYTL